MYWDSQCIPNYKRGQILGSDLGGKNLLIFGTTNVTIHLTDLPGTSVLDLNPNYNLSTSKFDCLLGEPWVQTGP